MSTQPGPARRRRGPVVGGSLLLVAALALALWGISTRTRALADVARDTEERAVPVVAVTTPETGAPEQEIVLPGTMQALTDAPIYARTNGYLKKWYVDIGGHVRAGQPLAELDAPELARQLEQARADLATAEANAKLAQTTAARYRDLITTNSVSQQDLDNANGNLDARTAAVESSRANVMRLEQLMAFTHIDAPFTGVVTARNVDVGALVDAGNNSKELFHVADTRTLRVFVNVPEIYSQQAKPGLKADLTLREFSGRRFEGRLVRTSNAIDVASRTLLAEIDVDNRRGDLLPGSYCDVHLKLGDQAAGAMKLPVNALIFRENGLQVATVGGNGRIVMKSITAGRDFGDSVEVLTGVDPQDRVVVNPPDSIAANEIVRISGSTPAK
ncbi:MAG TPA: efflux RND transporter periplasmic adaptor subunit [Vicinamibacterales bacterium]|nr:efflux RND transporter periplasmic adaptor subunit [Vicinamibacterales bacterium]